MWWGRLVLDWWVGQGRGLDLARRVDLAARRALDLRLVWRQVRAQQVALELPAAQDPALAQPQRNAQPRLNGAGAG